MKVAILENASKNHTGLILGWCEVLKIAHNEITVLTNIEIAERLENELTGKINLEIRRKGESLRAFIKRKLPVLSIQDIVIITSLQSEYLDYLFIKIPKPVYLTIHNTNTYFKPSFSGFKSLIKALVQWIWLHKAEGYILNSTNMKDYVCLKCNPQKPIYVMPFNLYLGDYARKTTYKTAPHTKDKLVFVIPGGVTVARKRYDRIFRVLRTCKPYMKLILLGAPNAQERGLEVLINARTLYNEGYDIVFYENYVDQQTFHDVLGTADFILSDINVDYRRYHFRETYGVTKDSGVSYTMITHCLPGIINAEFANLAELNTSTCYFHSEEELKNIILELSQNKAAVLRLKENARKNSLVFTPEKVLKDLTFLNDKKGRNSCL